VYTENIYRALSSGKKMLHPVMDSIEKALPVKRAALEYDGQPHHLFLLKTDETNAVTLYTATVNPGLPILYSRRLNI
jgi:hypothetical protein